MESAASGALVLGYGADLRGDDAVGLLAAEAVDSWNMPDVRALAVHQLTPELAESIAGARFVVFADAAVDLAGDAPEVRRVAAGTFDARQTHASTPEGLLALAEHVYGRAPEAWLVALPVESFDFGAELSPKARAGLQAGLTAIRRLLY